MVLLLTWTMHRICQTNLFRIWYLWQTGQHKPDVLSMSLKRGSLKRAIVFLSVITILHGSIIHWMTELIPPRTGRTVPHLIHNPARVLERLRDCGRWIHQHRISVIFTALLFL